MKTIIRRYRQRYAAPLASMMAMIVLALLAAWGFMIVWIKGGPQPVHTTVIAIPAPQMPPNMGHPA